MKVTLSQFIDYLREYQGYGLAEAKETAEEYNNDLLAYLLDIGADEGESIDFIKEFKQAY